MLVIEANWGVIIASASTLSGSVVRISKNVLSRCIELGTAFDCLRLSFAVVADMLTAMLPLSNTI